MRIATCIFLLLIGAGSAKESWKPIGEAEALIEGAKFTIGKETIRVSFERELYDPKRHKTSRRRWGYDHRLNPNENYVLTALTLTIDGKQFVVPDSHLAGLFNPKLDALSVSRDVDVETFSIDLFGGHTPGIYDVDFQFVAGIYVRRSFGYTDSRDGRKVDATLEEPYRSEQDGADQPATALESKPEGKEKPKPKSEGRSQ